MSERFFTTEEVAEKLKLNKVTVLRWIRSGKLPAVNLGGTSGYRLRGADIEAYLWAEYGGMVGHLSRAARALSEAADAARDYGSRFGSAPMASRSAELRQEAERLFMESEDFRDVQGFYRPASPPRTLRELQPFMAAAHVYGSGNEDFQVVAIMVRDAIADRSPASSVQAIRQWLVKAEASNPPDTEHGRLVRIAGPLLLERHRSESDPSTQPLG